MKQCKNKILNSEKVVKGLIEIFRGEKAEEIKKELEELVALGALSKREKNKC